MEKTTCLSTLTLLVIKELRLERMVHSASMADKVGKSPSAWAKIETGKSSFPMDSLFQAASALWTPPSFIISAAERYSGLLGQNGWGILHSSISVEEDDLLNEAQKYYNSPGFKRKSHRQNIQFAYSNSMISVLNSPIFNLDGSIQLIDLFRFVLDESFKAEQLSEYRQSLIL
jgi:transcriptional regulator with XRE-family HTH domain